MTAGTKTGFAKAGLAAITIMSLLLLGACSDTEKVLSEFTGDQGGSTEAAAPAPAPDIVETGTPTGQRVTAVRAELQRLNDDMSRHQTAYQGVHNNLEKERAAYGDAGGDLEPPSAGSGPSATLIAHYVAAQGSLDRMADEVGVLYVLARENASDLTMARDILGDIKAAAAIPGGNDKDRDQIAALQTAVEQDIASSQRFGNDLPGEIDRQNRYIAGERQRLAALGIAAPVQPERVTAAAAPRTESRPPLVTIRFDRANVPFEHALYLAVSGALDRKPDASFHLVAVSPGAGNAAQVAINASAARRNAGSVMRSLTAMGLPADRITISAITSPGVRTGEVRIYVK